MYIPKNVFSPGGKIKYIRISVDNKESDQSRYTRMRLNDVRNVNYSNYHTILNKKTKQWSTMK